MTTPDASENPDGAEQTPQGGADAAGAPAGPPADGGWGQPSFGTPGYGPATPPPPSSQDRPVDAQDGRRPAPRYGQYAPGHVPGQGPSAPVAQPGQVGTPPSYGQQYGQGQHGQPPAPRYGQPPAPQYGQPAAPQYGQGQYGQGQYGQQHAGPGGPPAGFAGAPFAPPVNKPGIVPLRPLTLGEIFDGAFGAIRHNPRVMLGMSTLVVVAATIVGALLGYAFSGYVADAFLSMPTEAGLGGMESEFATLYSTTIGTALTTALATPIVSGLLTVSIGQSVIGRRASVNEVWSQVGRRAWFLIGWALLQSLAFGLLIVVVVVVAVAGFAVDPALGGILTLVGIPAYLAAVIWVGARTGLVPPALALEGKPFWQTVARAWRLTRGSFWRLVGIYALAYVAMYIVSQIIVTPFSLVGVVALTGGQAFVGSLVVTLGAAVATIVMSLFLGSVVALLYIDLRMRREGLDVELAAAAASEQRTA